MQTNCCLEKISHQIHRSYEPHNRGILEPEVESRYMCFTKVLKVPVWASVSTLSSLQDSSKESRLSWIHRMIYKWNNSLASTPPLTGLHRSFHQKLHHFAYRSNALNSKPMRQDLLDIPAGKIPLKICCCNDKSSHMGRRTSRGASDQECPQSTAKFCTIYGWREVRQVNEAVHRIENIEAIRNVARNDD